MPRANPDLSFVHACARIESVLIGTARRDILAEAAAANDPKSSLLRLRAGMRSHTWGVPADTIRLDPIITRYDGQTRRAGLHALHDRDGIAARATADTTPADVL